MSAHTLAKCPFCGSAAYTQRRDINGRMPAPPDTYPSTWFACCENEETCGAEVGRFHSEAEAIAAWSRRPKAAPNALARVQALAFELLKEAELDYGAMRDEKRRVATLLNDIIEEAGNT